jgi:hypothetical protein
MANFNLDDYVTVNDRMILFYKEHPQGAIQTEIISNVADEIIIKAYIYRDQDDKRPCTGHAMEKAGSTFINKTSHIENCETSAVGRALAMMGYEIKKSVASREEVENARLNQAKPPTKPELVKTDKEETPANLEGFWTAALTIGYTKSQVLSQAGAISVDKWSQAKLTALYRDLKTKSLSEKVGN